MRARVARAPVLLRAALLLAALQGAPAAAEKLNGFELAAPTVPRELIRAGGPARDQIRSVDAPGFVGPEQASWVDLPTPVVGVELGGEARVYPVHLLEWHQIVNDEIGGDPIVVSFDPLTGAPLAFRRRVGARVLRFGVSGLVYNSGFLLYDRETESLWSQFLGEAIAGPLAGTKLERVRVRQEAMGAWLQRYPRTKVLERPAPKQIDYRYSPYKAYWIADQIPFPVAARDTRFHAKEVIVGVRVGAASRAYLGSLLTAVGGAVEDVFEGRRIRIEYDSEGALFGWDVPEDVELTEAYWFAWKAFHPETSVWRDPGGTGHDGAAGSGRGEPRSPRRGAGEAASPQAPAPKSSAAESDSGPRPSR